MKQETFRRELSDLTPDVPEVFHQRVEAFLQEKVDQEVNMKESTKRALYMGGRFSSRALIFALVAVLMLGSVAFAATQWGIFDSLGFMLGDQPVSSDAQMQKILHKETINDVEITIHEAAYDGRTLFIQYSYRMLDETEPFGAMTADGKQGGIPIDALEKLASHNVGWWIDHFWVNGQCMDMAANSGADETGTQVPGEIMMTQYWRLDNLDVALTGEVNIALPIGEVQPLSDYSKKNHPEKYDAEGNLLQPEKGLVTFNFNAGDVLSKVTTLTPNVETVTPEVTTKVSEAAFTPLMTYITLELEGNPDALAAYKAANGEGYFDDEGKLRWSYTAVDVHHDYILSLALVDGNGKPLFPDHAGYNGVGDTWAEFLYPYIAPENMPAELWLAPMDGNVADMNEAIRVK